MTCIVGYLNKELGIVTMGADSAATQLEEIIVRKDPKIFYNKEFLIGCTSSYRMIQLLRFSFIPPKITKKDIYEYMCTTFVNKVRDCFHAGGYLQIENNEEHGGEFLVGWKNRLFRIGSDFQVAENLSGIDSVGCGSAYALGALYAIKHEPILDTEKIEIALEAAANYSTGVREPFLIYETK